MRIFRRAQDERVIGSLSGYAWWPAFPAHGELAEPPPRQSAHPELVEGPRQAFSLVLKYLPSDGLALNLGRAFVDG